MRKLFAALAFIIVSCIGPPAYADTGLISMIPHSEPAATHSLEPGNVADATPVLLEGTVTINKADSRDRASHSTAVHSLDVTRVADTGVNDHTEPVAALTATRLTTRLDRHAIFRWPG